MRNLVCAIYFDSHGNPWMATGQDGQFPKLDRNGRSSVRSATAGIEHGQFIEASYWVMDKQDNLRRRHERGARHENAGTQALDGSGARRAPMTLRAGRGFRGIQSGALASYLRTTRMPARYAMPAR